MGKRRGCPLTCEWVNKMWSVWTVELFFFFALKSKGSVAHTTTRMKLEDIILSEINDSLKDKYCGIPLM